MHGRFDDESSEGARGEPSIGRGMANVRLYVMDGNGEIVPEGVGGELYIGGQGSREGIPEPKGNDGREVCEKRV